MKAENTADIRRRMLDLSNEIHGIREEAGRQVTLFLQYALAMISEDRRRARWMDSSIFWPAA